nr:hypothetical protein CFP56_60226 [Quercus suber]
MRRWQDHGEVLDSDDENVSLDDECSERPHKLAKLSKDDETSDAQTKGGGENELSFALSKQVAIRNNGEDLSEDESRTTHHGALTVQDERNAELASNLNDDVPEAVSKADDAPLVAGPTSSILNHGQKSVNTEMNLHAAFATSRFPSDPKKLLVDVSTSSLESRTAGVTNKPDNGVNDTQSPLSQRGLENPAEIATENHSVNHATFTSYPSSDLAVWNSSQNSDELHGRLASQTSTSRRTPLLSTLASTHPASLDALADNDLSSGLSSPVSDVDISPPPGFLRSMSNPARARTSPIGTQGRHNAEEAADAALAAALEADADQPTGRRRALRARKEQQLHPYLYEKAQYTRQWRSRGLQPVHYRVVDDRAAETQDSFHNSNSQNEEQMRSFSSSPTQIDAASHSDVMSLHSPKRITRREISGIVDNGEDELPDIRSVLDAARQDGHTRRKRQKLAHPTRAAYHWNRRLLDTSVDEFAVPLSPPPTSSDSRAKAGIVPKFRLPYGMSPVAPQLPTPHVSSDVCPQPRDVLSELDLESPPRTRRRGLTTKPTTTSATVEISSDGESESGAEQIPASSQDSLRLNRVKKRI